MSKLTKASRGQECTLQIFPFCDWDTEKTVPCHLDSEAKGMGNKSPNWWLVDGCASCHDIIDGRNSSHGLPEKEITACVMRGLFRTLSRRIEQGLVVIID